jgi:hypothetical protein
MRRPIDTAPRDGEDIWVEDSTGAFDVAHWSAEAGTWVWKNGTPINITPTRWYPIDEDVFFQEDQQSSSPVAIGRAGLAVSLIAVILVGAALIGVPNQFTAQDASERGRVESGRAVGLNLNPEIATAPQTFGQRETTAVRMQDTDGLRQALSASTVQRDLPLEEDTSRSGALAGESAAARSELVGLPNKLNNGAEQPRLAVASTADLQHSLHQEREGSAVLTSELAKVHVDLETTVALSSKSQGDAIQGAQAADTAAEELRKSLQQEQARAASLANQLAGTRAQIETRDSQLRKANDAAAQQRQAAEREIAELRQSLQQERERTVALAKEAKAAQAAVASAEQQRRGLEEAQAHATTLASELAGARREIESRDVQSRKVDDAAAQRKIAELQQSLQQERSRTKAMARELAFARRPIDERVAVKRAIEGSTVPATQTVAAAVTERPIAKDQDKTEAARLIVRASALLGQGNIGAARIVLERAAATDNARANFMLAETYDPAVLSAWGAYGTRGETAKARELYAKAHSGGIREAKERLDALRR